MWLCWVRSYHIHIQTAQQSSVSALGILPANCFGHCGLDPYKACPNAVFFNRSIYASTMPGHRNPLGMSGLADQIQDAVSTAKSHKHISDVVKTLAQDKSFDIPCVDLRIQVSRRQSIISVMLRWSCSSSVLVVCLRWTW
jgi:hypothetical protein